MKKLISLTLAAIVVLVSVFAPASTTPLRPVAAQEEQIYSLEQQLADEYMAQYYEYMSWNCPWGGCEQAGMQYMVDYALWSSGVTQFSASLLGTDTSSDCFRRCINASNNLCQAEWNSDVIKAGTVATASALACAIAAITPITLSLCLAAVTLVYLGALAAADRKLVACKAKAQVDCELRCRTIASCTPNPIILSWCTDYNFDNCTCSGGIDKSPVLIDMAGNGLSLTSPSAGVTFDIAGNGDPRKLSWTRAGSDDAFLVLDLNGNGLVDNGQELFGNFTPQSVPLAGERRHGFRALAEYDQQALGGNADGRIDPRDVIFFSLRLWRDDNHNGVSEPQELRKLAGSVIEILSLTCEEARRRDQHGNEFRYRAKVSDTKQTQVGRWAWDVFLQAAN